jgi:NADPH:quinone reductase-like Zn-dependent oxidoreductase
MASISLPFNPKFYTSYNQAMKILISFLFIFIFFPVEIESSKSVLVIGASGRVGSVVVTKLLDRNISVKGLVRSKLFLENHVKSTSPTPNLQYISGDVTDLSSLLEATKDCVAVIDCHGVRPPRFSKLFDLFRHPRHEPNHPVS